MFTINIWGLYEKVRDLRWENAIEIKGELNNLQETTNTLWEERAFAKEMRENLAYYLPPSYSSKVTFVSLNPLDLELGRARVYFIHAGKNYSADSSYSYNREGLKINRESSVELLEVKN